MDRTATEEAIKICLTETHKLLKEAERIAKAAIACAEAGSVAEAVTVSEEIGELTHDACRLQDAASLLNRLSGGLGEAFGR
jgi:hypothetical protein